MGCWHQKRTTGVLLIVSGAVMLAIALLFGLAVPQALQNRILGDLCVNSEEHPKYNDWINVTESSTKLYYWHIKNKDGFLYQRQAPQLEERGPYVYDTQSRRIDAMFDLSGEVTFKTYQHQTFNAKATKRLCPSCREDDQLSVLNLGHIGLITKTTSADIFSSLFISATLSNLLRDMDSALGSRNATLSQLGNVGRSHTRVDASFNPEFGWWLNAAQQFAPVLTARSGTNFNVSEMRGLYDALLDPATLGPPTDTAIYAACLSTPHQKDCGLVLWLANYLLSLTQPNSVPTNFNKTEAEQRITAALCPSPSSCFPVNDSTTMGALMAFIDGALRGYVLWSMDHHNYGLVTTRSQKELAFGYVMDKIRQPPAYPSGIHVPGVLISFSSLDEALKGSDSVTLYTCNSSSGASPFTWAAYNGISEVNKTLYPNATAAELQIRGHLTMFTPTRNIKACAVSYEPAEQSYDVFIGPLMRSVKMNYEKPVVVENIKLHRYTLGKDVVTVNGRTVFVSGLLDATPIYGFPTFVSYPWFLHGDRGLGERLGIPPADIEKHGSFADIEPVSGLALQGLFRIQVGAAVTSSLVTSSVHPKPLNVSYIYDKAPNSNVIPVYWREIGGVITSQQAQEMHNAVFDVLNKSCGLLVVLSFLGGVSLFFGIVFVALSCTKYHTASVDIDDDD